MSLSFPDLLALIIYLLIIMAIGLYFSRKNTNTEEYFVGGRSFSGWVIGLSLVGTSISSITFLAYPGDAYKTAWIRYLPNLMLSVAIFVAAYVFLPFFLAAIPLLPMNISKTALDLRFVFMVQ